MIYSGKVPSAIKITGGCDGISIFPHSHFLTPQGPPLPKCNEEQIDHSPLHGAKQD